MNNYRYEVYCSETGMGFGLNITIRHGIDLPDESLHVWHVGLIKAFVETENVTMQVCALATEPWKHGPDNVIQID